MTTMKVEAATLPSPWRRQRWTKEEGEVETQECCVCLCCFLWGGGGLR